MYIILNAVYYYYRVVVKKIHYQPLGGYRINHLDPRLELGDGKNFSLVTFSIPKTQDRNSRTNPLNKYSWLWVWTVPVLNFKISSLF